MSSRGKIIISVISVAISISLLAVSSVLAEEQIITPATAIALIVLSTVLLFITIFYAAKVDYSTGAYECRKCGHTFKPTFRAYILGMHTLTTRYLKCPKCEAKSFCRRKMIH